MVTFIAQRLCINAFRTEKKGIRGSKTYERSQETVTSTNFATDNSGATLRQEQVWVTGGYPKSTSKVVAFY